MIEISEGLWVNPGAVESIQAKPRGFAQPEALTQITLQSGRVVTTPRPADEVMALLFPAPILPKNIGRGGIAPC